MLREGHADEQDDVLCGSIVGIKAGKNGPIISHLMFADDTLLFGEATQREAEAFPGILNLYCNGSGQKGQRFSQRSSYSTGILFLEKYNSNNEDTS